MFTWLEAFWTADCCKRCCLSRLGVEGFCYYSMASVSPKKPRSSRRRNEKKKAKARQSPYLLPDPCDTDVHEDCVAIDCEMLVVRSDDRTRRTALASVAIVDRDGRIVYEKIVQPPSDRSINRSSH